MLDGVVDDGVLEEGVLVDVDEDEDEDEGVLDEEPDDGETVDAPDVEPVFSPGVVVDVVVEVLVPLPDDGVAGLPDDVVLAAHPDTNRVRTMV